MKRSVIILAVAMMASPALAAGQQQAVPAQAQAPVAAPAKEKMICEKQEVLGSRLSTRRVCKTAAEWAAIRLQDRMDLEKAQTQRGSAGTQ